MMFVPFAWHGIINNDASTSLYLSKLIDGAMTRSAWMASHVERALRWSCLEPRCSSRVPKFRSPFA